MSYTDNYTDNTDSSQSEENSFYKIHPELNIHDLIEDKSIDLEEIGMLFCIHVSVKASLKEMLSFSKDSPQKTKYILTILLEKELIVEEKEGVKNDIK